MCQGSYGRSPLQLLQVQGVNFEQSSKFSKTPSSASALPTNGDACRTAGAGTLVAAAKTEHDGNLGCVSQNTPATVLPSYRASL